MPLDLILSCKYDIYFRQGATVSAVNDWDFWTLLFGFSTRRNRVMFRWTPAQCPPFWSRKLLQVLKASVSVIFLIAGVTEFTTQLTTSTWSSDFLGNFTFEAWKIHVSP